MLCIVLRAGVGGCSLNKNSRVFVLMGVICVFWGVHCGKDGAGSQIDSGPLCVTMAGRGKSSAPQLLHAMQAELRVQIRVEGDLFMQSVCLFCSVCLLYLLLCMFRWRGQVKDRL